MWILSFHDKSYWLLENRKYTVGRSAKSSNSGIDFVISGDTSVSRKHITLEVHNSSEDAILHPSARSKLIVSDLSSRFGTKVDGQSIPSGSSCDVPQGANETVSIKLGSSTKLKLRWQSFVVTYSTGQSGDAHSTLWEHALALLRPLDIKLMPYIVKSTDVFVKTGKSTSSLYYALTQQIPVVNNQYIEALRSAAFESSQHGSPNSSLIPDVQPFLPDPQWRPNIKRTTCFEGAVFHIPIPEYNQALGPIVTSAGGKCVDAHAPEISEAIFIYPSGYEGPIPNDTSYTFDASVFSAIEECRGLKKSEIKKKGKSRETDINVSQTPAKDSVKSSKRGINVFDIMTSQGHSREPSKDKTRDDDKGTRASRIMNIMTSPDHSYNDVDDFSKATTSTDSFPPVRTSEASLETEYTKPASKPGRKRPARNRSSLTPPTKRSEIDTRDEEFAGNTGENDSENEANGDLDLDAIGELAIVENSLSVNRAPLNSGSNAPSASERPNFKAFKKQKPASHQSKTIEYDVQAPTVRHDYVDDFDMQDDNRSARAKLTDHNDMTELTSKSKLSGNMDTEESLFVRSDDESSQFDSDSNSISGDMSTRGEISQSIELGNASNLSSKDADDDFGFKFS